jgi:hypothetical protein
MGSFNRSCFLTQLPISDGDPVVGFFLLHRVTPSALRLPIYPTSFWAPVSLPFTGSYNGYGWMDADDTPENKAATVTLDLALAGAAKITKKGTTPEEAQAAHPYVQGIRDLDDIHNLVHDQDVFVPSHTRFHANGRAPLCVALCHADAWAFLLDTPVQEWGEDDTTLATLLADVDGVLDVAFQALSAQTMPRSEDLPGMWATLAEPNIRGAGLQAGQVSLLTTLVCAAAAQAEGNATGALRILRGLAGILVANRHMDGLHRTWAPGIGATQDEEWALIARFQDLVADLAERAHTAYCGEDDED